MSSWADLGLAASSLEPACSRTLAKVSPLVSSSACKVVAAEDRLVMTCSRLGRPRQTMSGSALTSAARTSCSVGAKRVLVSVSCMFHGLALPLPNSAAEAQSSSENAASSQALVFWRYHFQT